MYPYPHLRWISSTMMLLGGALAACGGDDGGLPAHCNPLGDDTCMMPWPSMAYLDEDTTTATGFRVALPAAAMPVNIDDLPVEPEPFNRWDGFSAAGPILVRFPGGVSATGLPGHADLARSTAADSPIVLLELSTGRRIPFFAELDMNIDDPVERTLIIRPVIRLKGNTRYGVAIRTTVQAAGGGPLAVPAGFAALRDGRSLDHARADLINATAPALFDALETAGVPRGDLALAWEFHTASDTNIRSDMTTMRDQALDALGAGGANQTFAVTETLPPEMAYRRYLGTFESPDFMTDGERDPSRLRRDAAGAPLAMGMRDANFAAIVPSCVSAQPLPRPTIIFGHGIFGSAEEYLSNSFVQELAEQYCFVIVAGDFIGLTNRQLALAPLAANDMNKALWISDKLQQSVIDFISLGVAVRGVMRTAPEFQYMSNPVIDENLTVFIGGSLGGTMGGTIMAYDPFITKGVLAVPGGNWSVMFERSAAWTLLQGAAQAAYPDDATQQLLIALFGMAMEPVDPITTAPNVIAAPLEGVPAKQILMWEAIGDSLVTNISTEMTARTMGVPVVGPSVKEPWGIDVTTDAVTSGFTIVDEHATPLPSQFNQPEDDNGTHSGCNERAALLRQTERFLLMGTITAECKVGNVIMPCDCSTGACD
jgi:hypothetical protein